MSQVLDFAMSVLHGDSDHQKWLLDEAQKFVDANPSSEVSSEGLKSLRLDALRYRYLRDADEWGEDGEKDSFEELAEATMDTFDGIVDRRMKDA